MAAELELERALAFCRDVALRCATRVQELPWGVAVLNDSLPAVWDLNYLWLDAVPAGIGSERLAAEADAVQGALAHRQIVVADEAAGTRLVDGFEALGWGADAVLVMSASTPPDRTAPAHPVIEVDEPGQRAFREEWLREWSETESYSEDVVAQLLAQKRVVANAVDTRFFLALVDGRAASTCELYTRDGVAQIEDVGTLHAYRGRGLARALVLHALGEARAAGCELVFLLADADDWPKELYGRLGFVTIGRIFAFLRKPSAEST